MIVKETIDLEEIRTVLCNAVIYDTISADGDVEASEFTPPINDDYLYIGGYVDNNIIGLLIYHKYLNGCECHVQVLPDYRKDYAKEFGEQALRFKGTLPLYAEIPDLYQNVLKYALSNGFEIIKKIDDGFVKNGVKHLVNILKYKE